MSEKTTQEMVNFIIDGAQVSAPKGTTVYTAAKQLGIDIPIFCYQDRMPPFGACRMCLVEVEKMGKLQTSCTLVATEGMVVKTHSEASEKGREEILEFLLINHPLDCPICDKGGECPLQDQTMKFGPGKSRFYEEKRHFKKPLPLSPVLMLDRERCIICARCTRFSDIVSGDHALELLDRGFKSEVGTPHGGTADSKFIGNTITICPVGALTSRVYRFRARPWDNLSTETTCTLCPVGCNMILDSRDGEVMRTRAKENRDVNDMWLCDKGWFGYEFSDHQDRLKKPLIRRNGRLEEASWEEALSLIASKFVEGKKDGKIGAIGGNPLTYEENFLLQKLIRQGAEVNHVDHRVGSPLFTPEEEGLPPGMELAIGECEELSFAILFGIDLTEEFPIIWLRLKEAINRGAKVIFIGNYAPEVTHHLSKTILHAPGKELETFRQHKDELQSLVEKGKKGAFFIGRQYLASHQRSSILAEMMKFRHGKSHLTINLLEGDGNSMGARQAGMHPAFGTDGEKLAKPGFNTLEILKNAAQSGWDYLHVAGANPAAQYPSKLWKEARAKLKFLVVQDLFLTETAHEADVVLPSLCFVEKEGHFINIEGRVEPLRPGKDRPFGLYSDGEIFQLIAGKLKLSLPFDQPLKAWHRISLKRPDSIEFKAAAPENKADLSATFAPALFDQGIRMKHNTHLVKMAKEPYGRLHPQEGSKRSLKEGDRVSVTANGNTVAISIKLDPKVAEGTIVLPLGFSETPVHELEPNLLNGLQVQVKKLLEPIGQ